MSFKLVYGKEEVVHIKFLIPTLLISQATHTTYKESLQEKLAKLMVIEKEGLLATLH